MIRIYYGDGTTYEGDRPPARDVQVILQHDPERGPYFQSGFDYYVWKDAPAPGRWMGCDIFGLYDYLIDSGIVLFGRTVTNAEYNAIYQRAKGDKKTFLPGERHP